MGFSFKLSDGFGILAALAILVGIFGGGAG
jgi:hypothetical protein